MYMYIEELVYSCSSCSYHNERKPFEGIGKDDHFEKVSYLEIWTELNLVKQGNYENWFEAKQHEFSDTHLHRILVFFRLLKYLTTNYIEWDKESNCKG